MGEGANGIVNSSIGTGSGVIVSGEMLSYNNEIPLD
jgi:hypothetical protein